ncbi:MAG: 23S rRNA (adenine(2503)-C(2))-methyltransferase RlmN [Anaerovoracaceae bacterium]
MNIKGMSLYQLEELFVELGEKAFRGRQVFRWIRKGVTDFGDMTDLPVSLQQKLDRIVSLESLEILRLQISKTDGTRKYLFGLEDGHSVESVFMKYKHGNSICISTQVGCPMGCLFCASGVGGFIRNLTAGEMEDQILSIEKDTGERISNVVVMGTGEPFNNYHNLAIFLNNIHSKEGLGLSWRSITLSTCGLVPEIIRFGQDFPQVNLAVSLHAPDDKIRNDLMPINRKYPIKVLLDACDRHSRLTGRRVTFEYALIDGMNDGRTHALELANLLKNTLCHVNLIPLNPVAESRWKGASRERARFFLDVLKEKGIPATIRRELGGDIDGACGQLRISEEKNK